MKISRFALLIVCLVCVSPGDARAQSTAITATPADRASVQQLSWLSGCWERRSSNGATVVEEQWMAPRAGTMHGMSRTTRGDSMLVEYEELRIFGRAGKIVYHAEPSGQTPTDFETLRSTDTLVTFENPAHDFPQRVIYRRRGQDSLLWLLVAGCW